MQKYPGNNNVKFNVFYSKQKITRYAKNQKIQPKMRTKLTQLLALQIRH